VAESIHAFFSDSKNLTVLEKLHQAGVEFPVIREIRGSQPLQGQIFVLTGGLSSLTRDEAKSYIEKLGGRVVSSVSKKTSVVVVGENPGSKLDKAKELGVRTIGEEEFKQLVGA
jgi:DNA ligase (NAD+)